jgi:LemA protein
MEVQLQRRGNLIPNLVEVVRGYTVHERGVLEEVTALRAQSQQAPSLRDRRETENALTDALKRLLALAEAYPNLKANEEFSRLHQSLVEIEDQLQMARRYYNGTVREFNILVETFPNNLVAGVLGFGRGEFFEVATTSERENPHVEIGS